MKCTYLSCEHIHDGETFRREFREYFFQQLREEFMKNNNRPLPEFQETVLRTVFAVSFDSAYRRVFVSGFDKSLLGEFEEQFDDIFDNTLDNVETY